MCGSTTKSYSGYDEGLHWVAARNGYVGGDDYVEKIKDCGLYTVIESQ